MSLLRLLGVPAILNAFGLTRPANMAVESLLLLRLLILILFNVQLKSLLFIIANPLIAPLRSPGLILSPLIHREIMIVFNGQPLQQQLAETVVLEERTLKPILELMVQI